MILRIKDTRINMKLVAAWDWYGLELSNKLSYSFRFYINDANPLVISGLEEHLFHAALAKLIEWELNEGML